jgi:hypothetical protein
MPLQQPRNHLPHRDGVYFTMEHDRKPVGCVVTHEALKELRGSDDHDTHASIFLAHRAEIEQTASEKFDRGHAEPDGIVLVLREDIRRHEGKPLGQHAHA